MGQSQSQKVQGEKGLVPKLRFKGFDEDWDKKRLDEVFSIFNGYAFSSAYSQEHGCRWVKIADVGINEIRHDSTSYLPISFKTQYQKYLLKEGDFIVALTRPILNGRLKISKVDKALDGSLLNQRVGKLISDNVLVFVNSMLQRESLIARIENRIAGTDPPNLSPSEINSLHLSIPTLPEQQKIALFLSAVDDKIRQLTRKKELLEHYKKGVMQQLFSGKLRFKDENGKAFPEWEEKRIDEIFQVTRGNVLAVPMMSKTCTNETPYPVYSSQTKENGLVGYYSVFLFENSLTWTTDGANAGDVNFRFGKFYCTNVCGVLINDEGYSNQCIAELLNKVSRKYVSYVGNPKLMNNVMSAIKITLPSSIIEQHKISRFLTSLDKQLNQIANQIDQTQSFKKGLLQQMFV